MVINVPDNVRDLSSVRLSDEYALRRFRHTHPVAWRLTHHKIGMAGFAIIAILVLSAVFAPVLAPRDPTEQNLLYRFVSIGHDGYLLGADAFGRDMLSRL